MGFNQNALMMRCSVRRTLDIGIPIAFASSDDSTTGVVPIASHAPEAVPNGDYHLSHAAETSARASVYPRSRERIAEEVPIHGDRECHHAVVKKSRQAGGQRDQSQRTCTPHMSHECDVEGQVLSKTRV